MNNLHLLERWLEPALVLVAAAAAGSLTKRIVVRRLQDWAKTTETRLDDLVIDVVNRHLRLWFVLAGISAAAQLSPLGAPQRALVHKLVVAGFFVSLTLAASRFVSGAVRTYAKRFAAQAGATSLMENLARIVVLAMGALLLLANLGISITPILTALGVGSLAVALALQDTLGNLFAGIHIVISGMVDVGDYIKLDSGQEGYVVDVGWRASRIRELPNNIIIVPNSKLAQAVVVNYNMPEKEQAALVEVGVSYDSDLAQVERVTVEVARQALREVAGGVPAFDPFIRYHAFGDSSVNFTVILRVKEFTDRYLVTHEFIKRLHERYRKEGIEIPFPQRVVHMKTP